MHVLSPFRFKLTTHTISLLTTIASLSICISVWCSTVIKIHPSNTQYFKLWVFETLPIPHLSCKYEHFWNFEFFFLIFFCPFGKKKKNTHSFVLVQRLPHLLLSEGYRRQTPILRHGHQCQARHGEGEVLTHCFPPLRFRNQVPPFAVRETYVSRHNEGTAGAPIMPRDVSLSDSKCRNLVAKTQRWAKMG